jgi:Protein of unknown function (DUF2909)
MAVVTPTALTAAAKISHDHRCACFAGESAILDNVPMSYFLVFLLVCVLVALASAGYFLITGKAQTDAEQPQVSKMTWALTIRIGLSVALFMCLLLSWKMGWIQPTGIVR